MAAGTSWSLERGDAKLTFVSYFASAGDLVDALYAEPDARGVVLYFTEKRPDRVTTRAIAVGALAPAKDGALEFREVANTFYGGADKVPLADFSLRVEGGSVEFKYLTDPPDLAAQTATLELFFGATLRKPRVKHCKS